jgi:uncharacterized protein
MNNSTNPFDPYPDPDHLYKDFTTRSIYIPMRDGVRLAADVILPRGLLPGTRIPAILQQTRYWRSTALRTPLRWLWPVADDRNPMIRNHKRFYTTRGYAMINVDVRGTGASFGVWRYPWEPASIEDAREIVEWIIHQSWSNGNVGGMGISYPGTTAELLLATGHPAVKAVLLMFNHPDVFNDIAYPGGVFNQRFVRAWCEMNNTLDRNILPETMPGLVQRMVSGVKPVDGKGGNRLLREALKEHEANGRIGQIESISFRDEIAPQLDTCADEIAVARYRQSIAESQAAIFGWASWMDAATADAALRRYLTFPNASRLVIGAWNHGGLKQASPYQSPEAPLSPPLDVQWREQISFFDRYLKTTGRDDPTEKTFYYYTLGAESWQKTQNWPPDGAQIKRWFLGPEHALVESSIPTASGSDSYVVNFSASSGSLNRWWSLGPALNQSVVYPDRASQDELLVTYSTAPLERNYELSGYPVIHLFVSGDTTDGVIYVYLEDVTPDGHVVYLTEGQLRVIHRRISAAPPPYCLQAPYHSYRQTDAMPLTVGEIALISFGLNPVSALIHKGHRLRISIAGHDEGTFKRYPANGTPVFNFYYGQQYPSGIDLPIR